MQTFVPFPGIMDTARTLDRARLGKQRVEAWQIYNALTVERYGWTNHPAVKMWDGYEYALLVYGLEMCSEWIRRGYVDHMSDRFILEMERVGTPDVTERLVPWWWHGPIHESHRAILYRKNPTHYARLWDTFDPAIEDYYWPTKEHND